MPRPKLRRRLCIRPEVTYFKPRGIPLRELQQVLWLVDEKGQDQVRAARHMHTSQSTIQRILTSAHAKVADALLHGKAIAIVQPDVSAEPLP